MKKRGTSINELLAVEVPMMMIPLPAPKRTKIQLSPQDRCDLQRLSQARRKDQVAELEQSQKDLVRELRRVQFELRRLRMLE